MYPTKTEEKVTVPFHQKLNKILQKYNYATQRFFELKLNERLIEFGRLAGNDYPKTFEENRDGLKL